MWTLSLEAVLWIAAFQDLDATTKFFTEALGWDVLGGDPGYPAVYSVPDVKTFDKAFDAVSNYPGVEVEFVPQQNPVGVGPRVHFMVFEPGGNRIEILVDP